MKVKKLFNDGNAVISWEVGSSPMRSSLDTPTVWAGFEMFGRREAGFEFNFYADDFSTKASIKKDLETINTLIGDLSRFALEYAKAFNKVKGGVQMKQHKENANVKSKAKGKTPETQSL